MNFFSTLIEYIKIFFGVIENTLFSLLRLITLLNNVVTVPTVIAPLVPSFLSACMYSVVAVGVLKLVIGR